MITADVETLAEELLQKWLKAQGLRFVTVAEFYLSFGRGVKMRLRQGMSMEDVALSVGLPVSECQAAVQYADSPDWFKFKVLTEGWSWKRIREAVRGAVYEPNSSGRSDNRRMAQASSERNVA